MDGVLWRDTQPIGDLPRIFEQINRMGLKVVLATNNATRSTDQFMEKVRGFGVSLEPWQVVNSAQAAASYLKGLYPNGGPVFIVGEDPLKHTLAEAGFLHDEKQVLAVIAALDRQLTYQKLLQATLFIRAGALFIGTNPDRTLPHSTGIGARCRSIWQPSKLLPIKALIIGKHLPGDVPVGDEPPGHGTQETLVVGDRLETDMRRRPRSWAAALPWC